MNDNMKISHIQTEAERTNPYTGKRAEIILAIMEKTGWSREYTISQVEDARKRLGVSYKGYLVNKFYEIPVERQEAIYQQILVNVKKQREMALDAVMGRTGWTSEYTKSQIEDAKKRIGISYRDYAHYFFDTVPVQNQHKKYQLILEKRAKLSGEDERQRIKQMYIQKVMKVTGWNYDRTVRDITEARQRTGCTYREYFIYKFYDLEKSVQETLCLGVLQKELIKKYKVNNRIAMLLCNKEQTNTEFDRYMKRPWCTTAKMTFGEFSIKFGDKRIIYKPVRGAQGIGVESFCVNASNIQEVFAELKQRPEGLVEQYVVQHPAMMGLSPSAVNTIRIVTVGSKSQPVTADGKQFDVAYAALRIGSGTSVVDNFHSGGMVAAVDLETGTLITNAADKEGNVFETHPVTGTTIKGFQIPHFSDALELVKDAYTASGVEGLIGWDIAVTEDGPVLIEINLRPGSDLLTTPYIAEKRGMRHIMEKYL